MPVLRDAACEKYRERDNTCCKKSHEYEMWTGFRNDSDKGCQQYHKDCVVAYPSVDFNILKGKSHDKEHAEGPCENDRQVFLDDVIPEVLVYEMVRCEDQNKQHYYAEAGKKDIHPLLIEEIDCAGSVVVFCVDTIQA